ncbi:hypothetical protein DERF_002546 [Dermatophagoides farinae]|uniref:Uncharacterized protein n=1 Tax=Dermatophagoides farinae TaxID=6954 RepID=A0A922IDZ3_DERFA|nr:hypothetical protein DERF_002546 [Dermatophagoides farinae]
MASVKSISTLFMDPNRLAKKLQNFTANNINHNLCLQMFDHCISLISYWKLFSNELRKHWLRIFISLAIPIMIPNKSIESSSSLIMVKTSADNHEVDSSFHMTNNADDPKESTEWFSYFLDRLLFVIRLTIIMVIMEILRSSDTIWSILLTIKRSNHVNKKMKSCRDRKSFIDLSYIERNRSYK